MRRFTVDVVGVGWWVGRLVDGGLLGGVPLFEGRLVDGDVPLFEGRLVGGEVPSARECF